MPRAVVGGESRELARPAGEIRTCMHARIRMAMHVWHLRWVVVYVYRGKDGLVTTLRVREQGQVAGGGALFSGGYAKVV